MPSKNHKSPVGPPPEGMPAEGGQPVPDGQREMLTDLAAEENVLSSPGMGVESGGVALSGLAQSLTLDAQAAERRAQRTRATRTSLGADTGLNRVVPSSDRSYAYGVPRRQLLSNADLDPVLVANFEGLELDVLRDHFGTRGGDNGRVPVAELAEIYEMAQPEVRALIRRAREQLPKSASPEQE